MESHTTITIVHDSVKACPTCEAKTVMIQAGWNTRRVSATLRVYSIADNQPWLQHH